MPEKLPKAAEKGHTGLRTNRIFILDTNVLIHDANALFAFKGVVIGIPFIVLEELDTFKREGGEKGHNVREAIRHLDALRKKGHLGDGVPLDHDTDGAILRVYKNPPDVTIPSLKSMHFVKDNVILQTIADLTKDGSKVTLVTKDINVRIKADALGLEAEDYIKGTVTYDQFYKGWMRQQVSLSTMQSLTQDGLISMMGETHLNPNQFIIVENEKNPNDYRLFRHLGAQTFKEVEPFRLLHTFEAKNVQQLMTLDLLMDDRVKLVTLVGPAGTGKTFLALLVGLVKVAYEHLYRKLMVTRPVISLGADIGYLPGDIQEKLHYWMQPVHDNLEFIASQMLRGTEEYLGFNKKERRDRKRSNREETERQPERPREHHMVERLQQQGIISLEAITYMRGRSIPFQFVFIDEVQNLTPHEVKTIVSRAGEGTKVILAGDPYQIDSPYLDFTSNGLTVTTEKLKDQQLFGTVFLEKSERSALAKLAAEVL
ncbi:MAG: PhoH family protein [Candidatus Babeliales bacterium]|jgi:PhoH-like ATPase